MLKDLMWFEMHQSHGMLLWKQQPKTEVPNPKLNQFEGCQSQILMTPRAHRGSLLLVVQRKAERCQRMVMKLVLIEEPEHQERRGVHHWDLVLLESPERESHPWLAEKHQD